MVLILGAFISVLLAAFGIGALIIHRRYPHTKAEMEPDYETPIADFSWGKQE